MFNDEIYSRNQQMSIREYVKRVTFPNIFYFDTIWTSAILESSNRIKKRLFIWARNL